MTFWTAERVAGVLGLATPADDRPFTRVWTDTRSVGPGDLFVALHGEHFDGHAFLAAARDAGATGAVVRTATDPVDGLLLFPVPDPRVALGRLARARRDTIPGPVVAVTGTNGKTATKEMLAAVLGTRWPVHATRANLNNEIGVPLTMLEAPADTEALVVEAGASEPGEIARLREIIRPTIAVITNVAAGHLAGFGSLEGVLAEKASLADGVPLVVAGAEPPALAEAVRPLAGDLRVSGPPENTAVDAAGRPRFSWAGHDVRLPLVGRHQAGNAMLALAVAEALALDPAAAVAALADVRLPDGRGEVIEHGGLTVLHDAYNANPASMRAALETAAVMSGSRPLVILLGTMLELGEREAAEHAAVADAVVAAAPALVGAVGAFVPAFAPHRAALGTRLLTADDPDALGRAVAARLTGNELVLLKASRGVRLERVLPHLLPEREVPCSTTS